jgi:hypothetical protein
LLAKIPEEKRVDIDESGINKPIVREHGGLQSYRKNLGKYETRVNGHNPPRSDLPSAP